MAAQFMLGVGGLCFSELIFMTSGAWISSISESYMERWSMDGMDMMGHGTSENNPILDDDQGRQAFNDTLYHGGGAAYEEEFPALPTRRSAAPPGLSRPTPARTSVDLGRAGTPKLPPGLNVSHAHPSPTAKRPKTSGQQATQPPNPVPPVPAPITPALPAGTGSATTKAKAVASVETKKEVIPASEGSEPDITAPVRPANLSRAEIDNQNHSKDGQQESGSISKVPEKLESPIADEVVHQPDDVEVVTTAPVVAAEILETSSAVSSQPGTPATPSRSTVKPRTLRLVTETTKQTDATPASAATEKSTSMPPPSLERHHSRRPSASSLSHTRSSTPAMSESYSFGASRANSPPPAIVGSAPERSKTKAQTRKDRKEKSKQAAESEQASGATTPVVEEVAPVISRQRKQKKRVESGVNIENPAQPKKEQEKPVILNKKKNVSCVETKPRGVEKESVKVAVKPRKQEAKKASTPPTAPEPKEIESRPSPLIHEPPQPKWTLRDLYNHVSKHPDADFHALLNAHISSVAEALEGIDPNNPLLNPPPLSSYRLPTDPRRGAEYLDANGYTDSNPFGMLYLTQDKKRAILNGHAVRISDASKPNDLLRRAMVSPTGTVWRHLKEAEEERVLELEERREAYLEEWGSIGLGVMDKLTVLEEDDYMNLEGGMERLGRNGEAHGVSWVMRDDEDDDGEEGEVDPDDDELGYDDDGDEDITDDDDDLGLNVPGGWETGMALGTVPEHVNITNKANILPPMGLAPGNSSSLRAMDVEKLMERIAEAQKEVEASRKEMEKLEKGMARKTKEVGKWREGALKVT